MNNNQSNRKRNIPLCIRISPKEYEILEKKLSKAKMTKTEYLVKILLDKEIKVCSFNKDMKELTFELQKIGVNLNQISKNLNSGIFQDATKSIQKINEEHTQICNRFLEFMDTVEIV